MKRDQGQRRHEKQLRRARRKASEAARKASQSDYDSRPEFVGAMDGAPDDQLQPMLGEDRMHVLALIIGPSFGELTSLIQDLCRVSGKPDFLNKKWNGGNGKKAKRRHQELFCKTFIEVLKDHDNLRVLFRRGKESAIRGIIDTIRVRNKRFDSIFVKSPSGKSICRFNLKQRVGDFNLPSGQLPECVAYVLWWTSATLIKLYKDVTENAGCKPRWTLHTDRFPNDPNDVAIAFIQQELARISNVRVTVQWTNPERAGGPDMPLDNLADHLATWAVEASKKPDSVVGQLFSQLLATYQGSLVRVTETSVPEKGHVQ